MQIYHGYQSAETVWRHIPRWAPMCSTNHMIARLRDGEVRTWGINDAGQFGLGLPCNEKRHGVPKTVHFPDGTGADEVADDDDGYVDAMTMKMRATARAVRVSPPGTALHTTHDSQRVRSKTGRT